MRNNKWDGQKPNGVHNKKYVKLVQQYDHEEWGKALQHCALEVLQELLDENGEYRKHLQQNIIRVVRKLQRLPNRHEYTSLSRLVLATAVVHMVAQRNGITRRLLHNLTGVAMNTISLHSKRVTGDFKDAYNQRHYKKDAH